MYMKFRNLKTKTDLLSTILIFVFVFAIYTLFLAPTVIIGDPAEFSTVSYLLGVPHPHGYPLYTMIGHLFSLIPLKTVAYRLNLMSAFFGALTVSLLYILTKNIIKQVFQHPSIKISRFIAIIISLSFAFSPTFWKQCEIAEVYTFNMFLIVLTLTMLIIWSYKKDAKYLYGFALSYGLSIGAHLSNILFIPAFLSFFVLNDQKILLDNKKMSIMALFFALGLTQFLYILFRGYMEPLNLAGWWDVITAHQYNSYFSISTTTIPTTIYNYFVNLIKNLHFLGIFLAALGLIELWKKRRDFFVLITLMIALNVGFFINYSVFDVEVMFIPSFMAFWILGSLGTWSIFNLLKNKIKKEHEVDKKKWEKNEGGVKEVKKVNEGIKRKRKGYYAHFTCVTFIILLISLPLFGFFLNYDNEKLENDINYAYFVKESMEDLPPNSVVILPWRNYALFNYFKTVEKVNPSLNIISANDEEFQSIVDKYIDSNNVFITSMPENLLDIYYAEPICPPESKYMNKYQIYRLKKK